MSRPAIIRNRKIRIFNSLRGKLLVLCICLLLLPIFILGFSSYQASKKQAYVQTINELEIIIENWETIIKSQINNISTVLLREEVLVEQKLKSINETVRIIIKTGSEKENELETAFKEIEDIKFSKTGYIMIFKGNGDVIYSGSIKTVTENLKNSHPDFFGQIVSRYKELEKGNVVTVKHFWKENDFSGHKKMLTSVSYYKALNIYITVNIHESDYKSIGYEKRIKRELRFLMAERRIGKDGYLFVVNTDGEYIVSKDNLRDGENILDDESRDGRKIAEEIIDKNIKTGGREFVELRYSWMNILTGNYEDRISVTKYIPEWKWIIGATMLNDDFLSILTTLKKYILFLSLFSVLTGSIVAVFLSKKLTSPVLNLEQVMRKASEGDYENDIDKIDISTNDEIASLAESFNQMMVNLKERRIRLNNEKNLLATLIDSSPDPTYFQDTEGNYLNCNSSFEKLVKIRKKYLIGNNDSSFLPNEIIESFMENNRKTLDTGKLSVQEIYVGNEKIFETVTTPFYSSNGRIQGIIGVSRDISARVRSEKELRENEKRLRQIIENASDIIFTTDLDGNIMQIAESWANHLGYDISEIIGKNVDFFLHDDDKESVQEALNNITEADKGISVDFRSLTGRGVERWYTCNSKLLRDEDNNPFCIIGIARDITEQKKNFEKLRSEAELDALTDVFNRRMLDFFIESEIAKSVRYKSIFSVIMIDLDFFKKVNDNYGHDKGDDILRNCAEIFKKNIRHSDLIARYGGEEFIILAPNTDIENGKMLAEKIRTVIETFDFGLKENLTASFGVSSYIADDTPETVMKRADKALYSAKKQGRNRVVTE